jgi:2,4-dienoyl-CoA reductase-like NADH-dependent reductase (Old Yellow Enzyme family)
MADLFDPFTLRGVTLRNRIGVSPMCMYWSDSGKASDWHLVHLGSRAVGGAALVIAEATAVEDRGRISPRDAGLWSDDQIGPLVPVTRFLKKYGAVPAIQLAHAGRKAATPPPYERGRPRRSLTDAEGGWTPVAPSAIPFQEGDRLPTELSLADIRTIQQAFRDTTLRAREAGFDWVELHAAHGYLAHEFLSPLANRRRDNYGGSFENRIRFTVETAQAMRAVWPDDRPLSVRLSATDWAEGGWTLEESVELSRRLKAEGVDLIACSSGGMVPHAKIPVSPGYQVPFAEAIRRGAAIPTATVGLITEPAQADAIVREGKADVVLLARQMLRDPYWPFRAARALSRPDAVHLPQPYDYAV